MQEAETHAQREREQAADRAARIALREQRLRQAVRLICPARCVILSVCRVDIYAFTLLRKDTAGRLFDQAISAAKHGSAAGLRNGQSVFTEPNARLLVCQPSKVHDRAFCLDCQQHAIDRDRWRLNTSS